MGEDRPRRGDQEGRGLSGSNDPRAERRELRSFGRLRGRTPSPRQQALLAEALPRWRLDLTRPFVATGRPLWLEIGFGGGEHLIQQAEGHPGTDFIGCEPYQDGVIKALAGIEEKGLANVRIFMGDARDVLRWLPERSVERIFILFPDPWPKARHLKRRLVNESLARSLARVLAPKGELRLASDIADYAEQMRAVVATSGAFEVPARHDPSRRPDDWPPTRYEAKAQAAGRSSRYLIFVRR